MPSELAAGEKKSKRQLKIEVKKIALTAFLIFF